MPSDAPSALPEAALRDILFHIDLIERFVAGLDGATFRGDIRTVYAVTRCLEIISEASRRLPDALQRLTPKSGYRFSEKIMRKAKKVRAG